MDILADIVSLIAKVLPIVVAIVGVRTNDTQMCLAAIVLALVFTESTVNVHYPE